TQGEAVRPITARAASKSMTQMYLKGKTWMAIRMDRTRAPKFATEQEEADWWDAHQDMVEADLRSAIQDGTAERGTAKRLCNEVRERRRAALEAAKTLIATLSDQDRTLFHELAVRAGSDDQTYIQELLLEALASAETKAA